MIIFVIFHYSNHFLNDSICFMKSGLRKIVWFLEKNLFVESIFFKSLKFPATFINFEGQIRNLDLHALQAYMHTYALTCLDIMDCGRALLDGNTERTQVRKIFRIYLCMEKERQTDNVMCISFSLFEGGEGAISIYVYIYFEFVCFE